MFTLACHGRARSVCVRAELSGMRTHAHLHAVPCQAPEICENHMRRTWLSRLRFICFSCQPRVRWSLALPESHSLLLTHAHAHHRHACAHPRPPSRSRDRSVHALVLTVMAHAQIVSAILSHHDALPCPIGIVPAGTVNVLATHLDADHTPASRYAIHPTDLRHVTCEIRHRTSRPVIPLHAMLSWP